MPSWPPKAPVYYKIIILLAELSLFSTFIINIFDNKSFEFDHLIVKSHGLQSLQHQY